MVDMAAFQNIIAEGLESYLEIPMVYAHKTEAPPQYPYGTYTVTTLINENKSTWNRCDDGKQRKPFTQTWTVTIHADEANHAMELAIKAYDWLDYAGKIYHEDNHVIIQSVKEIINSDNIINGQYEYRYGFDVVFQMMDELDDIIEQAGFIETARITREESK